MTISPDSEPVLNMPAGPIPGPAQAAPARGTKPGNRRNPPPGGASSNGEAHAQARTRAHARNTPSSVRPARTARLPKVAPSFEAKAADRDRERRRDVAAVITLAREATDPDTALSYYKAAFDLAKDGVTGELAKALDRNPAAAEWLLPQLGEWLLNVAARMHTLKPSKTRPGGVA